MKKLYFCKGRKIKKVRSFSFREIEIVRRTNDYVGEGHDLNGILKRLSETEFRISRADLISAYGSVTGGGNLEKEIEWAERLDKKPCDHIRITAQNIRFNGGGNGSHTGLPDAEQCFNEQLISYIIEKRHKFYL